MAQAQTHKSTGQVPKKKEKTSDSASDLRLTLPTNPLPTNDSPNPNLSTLQIAQAETFHSHLRLLPALLPSADLLARAVPLGHDGDVSGAKILLVFLVHGTGVLAFELSVAQRDDVASADFVKLHDGSVGEIGVDEGAESAVADWVESFGLSLDEV